MKKTTIIETHLIRAAVSTRSSLLMRKGPRIYNPAPACLSPTVGMGLPWNHAATGLSVAA